MKIFSILGLVISASLVALFAGNGAHGSGMIMHMEASNRAIQYLSRTFKGLDLRLLLNKHKDAFLTGSVYPDSFYAPMCEKGAFTHISKMSHGLNFIEPALDHLTTTYIKQGKITTVAGEKLLAFLLGVVAHDIQDIVWHGFGIDQGLVNTIAQANFHGDFDAAHSVSDFGGDSVLLYESNFVNLHLATSQWYIPRTDLYDIYKKMLCARPNLPSCDAVAGLKKALLICPRLSMGRAMLNKMLIHRWYVSFGMKAPMLISPRFNDFFVGGMSDMSSWTMQRIETALRYIDNKSSCTRFNKTDDNTLYWSCGDQPKFVPPPASWMPGSSHSKSEKSMQEVRQDYVEGLFKMTDELVGTAEQPGKYGTDDDLIEAIESGDAVYLRPKGALKTATSEATMNELLEMGEMEAQREADTPEDQFAASNTDHYQYFVSKAYSQIGQALVSADVDNDGFGDLIVGVPGWSADNRYEEGRVYIIKGSAQGLPSKNVDLENVGNAIVISAPFNGTGRFGYSVAVLDFNVDGHPDIAVSAPIRTNDVVNKPYSGVIYIYYGQEGGKFGPSPDITIDCNMRYCNYGTTLAAGDVNRDGNADLIIGSPYASQSFEKYRQNGFVSVFHARIARGRNTEHYSTYRKADAVVWGSTSYSWFGYSVMTASVCDILIGAPGEKTASNEQHGCAPDQQMSGAVYCYSQDSGSLHQFATGKKEFEFFGASLAEGYPNGRRRPSVLAIGAPNSDNVGHILNRLPYLLRQSGTVYLYNSKNKAPLGELVGDRLYGAFGRVIHFDDIDHDTYDDLIVGAPVRSPDVTNVLYAPGIGELYLYYGRVDFPGSALQRSCPGRFSPCPADQADGIFGTGLRRAQLGSNAAIVKSANLTQIVVAQQHAEDYGRLAGKLLLFNDCLSITY